MQANYQNLGNGPGGGYYLVLSGRNQSNNNPLTSVSIYTDSLNISQGSSYILKSRRNGNASGRYFGSEVNVTLATYHTADISFTGQLFVRKLDEINQIISGTFWFKAVNSAGDTINVTDGRFDVRYTR